MPSSVYYGGTGTSIVSGIPSALDYSVQASKVASLQTAVGDSSAGLVKDVTDLKTIVGDNTAGLVKRVSDLELAAQTAAGSSAGGEG